MAGSPPSARDAAIQIIRTLRAAGQVAYLAGGCVRDTLLGLAPQDFDVATDAKPDAIRALFHKTRFVGEAFGVVLVRLMHHDVEVATFRSEWGYEDGRRPSHVEFTDARHDALRRDFTINGLFADPLAESGQSVIDFVDGKADLEGRVIRAIGNPRERFTEDFLRMLRAVRFAARLGFAIEEETGGAIREQAGNLARISRERIGQEMEMMLGHASRAQAVRLIEDLGLDAATLREEHRVADPRTLAALPPEAEFAAALAAWMLDRHLPARPGSAADEGLGLTDELARFIENDVPPILQNWRVALCLSNDARAATETALALLPRAADWPRLDLSGKKRLLAEPGWSHTLSVLRASRHRAGVGPALQAIDAEVPTLMGQGVVPRPWITGDDLIALGRKPGPNFKRLLDAVYDRQLDGSFKNRQAALDWLMQQA